MRRKNPKPRSASEQLEIMETVAAAFARAEMPIQAIWRRFHEEQESPEYDRPPARNHSSTDAPGSCQTTGEGRPEP